MGIQAEQRIFCAKPPSSGIFTTGVFLDVFAQAYSRFGTMTRIPLLGLLALFNTVRINDNDAIRSDI